MNTNRIKWREFVQRQAYLDLQNSLLLNGYQLVVELDDNNVATDVFIKVYPEP